MGIGECSRLSRLPYTTERANERARSELKNYANAMHDIDHKSGLWAIYYNEVSAKKENCITIGRSGGWSAEKSVSRRPES